MASKLSINNTAEHSGLDGHTFNSTFFLFTDESNILGLMKTMILEMERISLVAEQASYTDLCCKITKQK